MGRSWIVILPIAATTLSSCSEPVAEAEERYGMAAENWSDPSAKCEMAGEVKRIALEEGDEDAYRFWSTREYNDCSEIGR